MAPELPESSSRSLNISDLISHNHYEEALALLHQQLAHAPADLSLQVMRADVLILQRHIGEAVRILTGVADEFARQGLAAQSVAVLKKIQKLAPERTDLDVRVVDLFKASAPRRTAHFSFDAPADAEEAELLAAVAADLDVDAMLSVTTAEAKSRGRLVSSLLFEDFTDEELLEVIRGLELLTFEAGDILITEGERGETLYVLTSGTAKAFVRNKDEGSTQVRQLNEGDFFGEIAMLSGSRRTATITAATRCELLRLERSTLDVIASTHPRVREVLQRFYEERAHNAAEAEIRGLEACSSEACRVSGILDVRDDDAKLPIAREAESSGDAQVAHLRQLAIDHSRRQNWPDAVLAWQQYTRLEPEDVDAATALALLYGKLGRWIDAAHAFEKLVQRNSTDPALLFNLGVSYRQLELLPQSAAAYRQALVVDPQYEKARQALASVVALTRKRRAQPEA